MTVVSIHQPQYLPWLPYLLKVAESDRFVLLESVDFQKNGLQNRNQIKTAQGAHWLTVPVQQRLGQKIDEVQIDGRTDWRRKHWQTIQQNYGKAPAFRRYRDELEDAYAREWTSLNALNGHLFALLCRWMEIATPIIASRTLSAQGQASELVLNLCLELGATRYLSGTGGQNYLDAPAFAVAGIEIVHRASQLPTPYVQPHASAGFINTLSALDILLCCGPDWRKFVPAPAVAA